MNAEGVVLAGGTSTRMGGNNKALIEVGGQPLFRYAVKNLRPWVNKIRINANDNVELFESLGFETCSDGEFLHMGPLAGIYSAMLACEADVLLVAPCDQLELPKHIYQTLLEKVDVQRGAFASNGVDDIPTCAALPVSARAALRKSLQKNTLRLMSFIHEHCQKAVFPKVDFCNVNYPPANKKHLNTDSANKERDKKNPINKENG